MPHRTDDPNFIAILDPDSEVVKVASGFKFTEGPIWHPSEGHLTFSDIPGNQMFRLFRNGQVRSFRQPSNMANGSAYAADGSIVCCEHATSRVVRIAPGGEVSVLAHSYEGRQLNSPNDIIVDHKARIYFTDPTFGRQEYYGVPRPLEMETRGVYRLDPNGSLTRVCDDFEQPNGLCLSLDRTKMFVNDTSRGHIRVFDIAGDGSLSGGAVWAVPEGDGAGLPDGLKIDAAGYLYCTGPDGIHVFDGDGNSLGVIHIPEYISNFNWGDADLQSLYVTASTSIYRVRTQVPGLAGPLA